MERGGCVRKGACQNGPSQTLRHECFMKTRHPEKVSPSRPHSRVNPVAGIQRYFLARTRRLPTVLKCREISN